MSGSLVRRSHRVKIFNFCHPALSSVVCVHTPSPPPQTPLWRACWGWGTQTEHCQNHILTPAPSEASDLITGIINKHGLTQYFLAREDEKQACLSVVSKGTWKGGCGTCEDCSFLEVLPEPGGLSLTSQSCPRPNTRVSTTHSKGCWSCPGRLCRSSQSARGFCADVIGPDLLWHLCTTL